MSNYVLNNWGNFHLQLLRLFKEIAVFVVTSGVFFIATACSTYREVKLRMKNNVTIVHNYKCICINTKLRQTTKTNIVRILTATSVTAFTGVDPETVGGMGLW